MRICVCACVCVCVCVCVLCVSVSVSVCSCVRKCMMSVQGFANGCRALHSTHDSPLTLNLTLGTIRLAKSGFKGQGVELRVEYCS